MSSAASSEQRCGLLEARPQAVGDVAELRLRRRMIGLRDEGTYDRGDRSTGALRHGREQVPHEVDPAALPRGPVEDRADGLLEPFVRVETTTRTKGDAAFHQTPEKRGPERAVSDGPTSTLRTCRSPSFVMPTTTTVAWLTTRASTRTF